jgi:predicted O-methyltransferase YrrM
MTASSSGVAANPARMFARVFRRLNGSFAGVMRSDGVSRMLHNLYVYERCKEASGLSGVVVECGVGRGDSIAAFLSAHLFLGVERRYFAFDTFSGLTGTDRTKGDPDREGDIAHSLDYVNEKLRNRNFTNGQLSQITFIKGDARETTKGFAEPIALLHIDLDIYDPYRVVLANLYDRVVPGGIILFDEYREPKWPGATRAIDEFFGDAVSSFRYAAGKAYFVKPSTA